MNLSSLTSRVVKKNDKYVILGLRFGCTQAQIHSLSMFQLFFFN